MSWGPNVGPPPLGKGRDESPSRRTVVTRTGGGYKYREDIQALHEDLRAAVASTTELQEKLTKAELELSESSACLRHAEQQLVHLREAAQAAQDAAAQREATLMAKLREALEAVSSARNSAQSALGSQAATHVDLHQRAEECAHLQRKLSASEANARRVTQQLVASEERAREEARAGANQVASLVRQRDDLALELEELRGQQAGVQATLARSSVRRWWHGALHPACGLGPVRPRGGSTRPERSHPTRRAARRGLRRPPRAAATR